MTKSMDLEPLHGPLVSNMKENGRTVNRMALLCIQVTRELREKEFGKTEDTRVGVINVNFISKNIVKMGDTISCSC